VRITLELNSTLDQFLPDDAPLEHDQLELDDEMSPLSLIEKLAIPPHTIHLVFLDGRLLQKDEWATLTLSEGDTLSIWPLLAGG
jgi:sulfur carrier protein ThiS